MTNRLFLSNNYQPMKQTTEAFRKHPSQDLPLKYIYPLAESASQIPSNCIQSVPTSSKCIKLSALGVVFLGRLCLIHDGGSYYLENAHCRLNDTQFQIQARGSREVSP